ncbi:DUF4345 domain-containing protein [Stakelama sp. CBK3Z-3]|uniref:DUF4345 domain-containing protein n=1 Tax=Stakelama flava TaxID=2860338 RepID=A0ABS6XNF7_9SPHN|nr:DUF4345 domain-containing protein [Stakelama flava]MBW4331748.1 DUF4345 domain-containing protein [Stakelama flava]
MTLDTERRILQLLIAMVALFSLSAAVVSIFRGPGWLGYLGSVPTDLDSHFRYLSGELLAIAIGLFTCIPRIEARGYRFRTLGFIIVAGGLARFVSLWQVGHPSQGHMVAMAVELIVMPLLLGWQAFLASRWRGMRMPLLS